MSMISIGDVQSLLNHFEIEGAMVFLHGSSRSIKLLEKSCLVRQEINVWLWLFWRCCGIWLVNHYWQNVMFKCAFLLNEITTSFKWLSKSFLNSMGNQSPVIIFTNQYQAMSNAIEKYVIDYIYGIFQKMHILT